MGGLAILVMWYPRWFDLLGVGALFVCLFCFVFVKTETEFVGCLTSQQHASVAYLRDGSAQASLRAATLR